MLFSPLNSQEINVISYAQFVRPASFMHQYIGKIKSSAKTEKALLFFFGDITHSPRLPVHILSIRTTRLQYLW